MKTVFAWHRPLMAVTTLMAISAVISIIGAIANPIEVMGVNAWFKPIKFSLSILLYCVTWAWLIDQLPRWKKFAYNLGTVMAITLAVEQIIIVGAAASGTTSHFNVTSPFATVLWGIMAVSITVLYIASFLTTIALFFLRLPRSSTTLALRLGAILSLVGLGLAYLMTTPTSAQLSDFQGIAGAHAVGLPDGGPGIPVLGWSTVGGDLRIPHFIGMHAIQILPLCVIALAWFGRGWKPLADDTTRRNLVIIASAAYAAIVANVTFQALAGQSIAHPSGVFLAVGIAISGVAIVASIAVIALSSRKEKEKVS